MATLEYRTAGESHGRAVVALVEGMPAGLRVDEEFINAELRRRQGGYGRGGRMKIEKDEVRVISGVRRGISIGSPIALEVINRDYRIDEAPPLHVAQSDSGALLDHQAGLLLMIPECCAGMQHGGSVQAFEPGRS